MTNGRFRAVERAAARSTARNRLKECSPPLGGRRGVRPGEGDKGEGFPDEPAQS